MVLFITIGALLKAPKRLVYIKFIETIMQSVRKKENSLEIANFSMQTNIIYYINTEVVQSFYRGQISIGSTGN